MWPKPPFVRPCALTNAALLRDIRTLESKQRTSDETDALLRLYDELHDRLDSPYDRSFSSGKKR